jgi:hypothetical protein
MARYVKSPSRGIVAGIDKDLAQRESLVWKLCEAGRSCETPDETLDRLLLEREAVCRLLDRSGATKFDDPGFRCSFDIMVSRFLKPSKKDLRKKT